MLFLFGKHSRIGELYFTAKIFAVFLCGFATFAVKFHHSNERKEKCKKSVKIVSIKIFITKLKTN